MTHLKVIHCVPVLQSATTLYYSVMCDGPIKVGDILWLHSFNIYALQIYITNEICQIILFYFLFYSTITLGH